MPKNDKFSHARKDIADALTLPTANDWTTCSAWQKKLRSHVDNYVSMALDVPLKHVLAEKWNASFVEKQSLVKWCSDELRSAHLCFAHPVSDEPSHLVAVRARESDPGRFYLEANSGRGVKLTRVTDPEELKLIGRPITLTGFAIRPSKKFDDESPQR